MVAPEAALEIAFQWKSFARRFRDISRGVRSQRRDEAQKDDASSQP